MNGAKVAKLAGKSEGANADFLGEDGKIKTPRLVLEFTMENKAKANEQAKRKDKVSVRRRTRTTTDPGSLTPPFPSSPTRAIPFG